MTIRPSTFHSSCSPTEAGIVRTLGGCGDHAWRGSSAGRRTGRSYYCRHLRRPGTSRIYAGLAAVYANRSILRLELTLQQLNRPQQIPVRALCSSIWFLRTLFIKSQDDFIKRGVNQQPACLCYKLILIFFRDNPINVKPATIFPRSIVMGLFLEIILTIGKSLK